MSMRALFLRTSTHLLRAARPTLLGLQPAPLRPVGPHLQNWSRTLVAARISRTGKDCLNLKELRLISDKGEMLGILNPKEALKIAQQRKLERHCVTEPHAEFA